MTRRQEPEMEVFPGPGDLSAALDLPEGSYRLERSKDEGGKG